VRGEPAELAQLIDSELDLSGPLPNALAGRVVDQTGGIFGHYIQPDFLKGVREVPCFCGCDLHGLVSPGLGFRMPAQMQ